MTLFLLALVVSVLAVVLLDAEHPALSELRALDKALIAKSWPALSAFWNDTFTRFLLSGKRQLVIRVGRRGGKSSSLVRLAVAFALSYDVSHITPGDVGIVGFVSVSRDEAAQRLRMVRAQLDALKVRYKPIDGGVELVGKPIVFKTFSATIGGVVGGTWILAVLDEVARWRDADTGANPAREVLASVRPTMATQPNARIVLASSPLGTEDAHAKAYDEGTTAFQLVAFAETWIANPTITEADTHALEPHEPTRLREYGAQPQIDAIVALDIEGLARSVRPLSSRSTYLHAPEGVIDSSGGKHDAFIGAVFAWVLEHCEEPEFLMIDIVDERTGEIIASRVGLKRDDEGKPIRNTNWHPPQPRLWLAAMLSFEGDIAKTMKTSDVAERIADQAHRWGATRVHGDQFGAWSWSSDLAKHSLVFEESPWTAPAKNDAVIRLRQLIREGTLVINPDIGPEAQALIAEAKSFVQFITPSGTISFRGRGTSHDDRVMTLLLASRVDAEGRLQGSPLATCGGRTEILDYDDDGEDY